MSPDERAKATSTQQTVIRLVCKVKEHVRLESGYLQAASQCVLRLPCWQTACWCPRNDSGAVPGSFGMQLELCQAVKPAS